MQCLPEQIAHRNICLLDSCLPLNRIETKLLYEYYMSVWCQLLMLLLTNISLTTVERYIHRFSFVETHNYMHREIYLKTTQIIYEEYILKHYTTMVFLFYVNFIIVVITVEFFIFRFLLLLCFRISCKRYERINPYFYLYVVQFTDSFV